MILTPPLWRAVCREVARTGVCYCGAKVERSMRRSAFSDAMTPFLLCENGHEVALFEGTGACQHVSTKRGKDIPRRWGSFRTQVCCDCGDYRWLTHHDEPVGPWHSAREYAAAVAEDQEE